MMSPHWVCKRRAPSPDTASESQHGRRMISLNIVSLVCLTLLWCAPHSYGQTEEMPGAQRTYTLSELLDVALQHSPLMIEGQGRVDEQLGKRMVAQAYPNPSLHVQGGHGTVLDPSSGVSITERYVTMSQPLEWPGKRIARQEAAEAGVKSAQASLKETEMELKARVKQAFYKLLLAQEFSSLSSQNLAAVKKIAQAVISRVEAGEAPPFEKVKIQVELLRVQKETTRATGEVQTALASLNALTGGAIGNRFSIGGDFAVFPKGLDADLLAHVVLKHNPTLVKLEESVKEATQRHIQQQQSRVPDVTLSGSYQRVAGAEEFLGGFSVPLPLWSQRQGDIAQAMGFRRQAEAMLLKTQQSIRNDIVKFYQQAKVADAHIVTFREGLVKEAQEALRIAEVSFRLGEANLLEVLDAQRVMSQTLLGYAEVRYDLSLALTELERLSGMEL